MSKLINLICKYKNYYYICNVYHTKGRVMRPNYFRHFLCPYISYSSDALCYSCNEITALW
nr:MAG TPA: hypothetical protein [Caudoviricetes sp.]DAX12548.1 MAG TPA: hypothetical protein [Bacteriophage sp.]